MDTNNQTIALANTLPEFSTFQGIMQVAEVISQSKMFGCNTAAQAATLMLLAQSEGQHPFMAMRKWHIVENKPSMRAEAMLAEYASKTTGGVIWHVRSDEIVAATFFADKSKIDDKATDRAVERFNKLWLLEVENTPNQKDRDDAKISKLLGEVAKLSRDGENTIVRTMADAINKGLAMTSKGELKDNWAKSPRQMLTARAISEGIRLTHPSVIVGIYSTEEELDLLQDKLREPKTPESIRAQIDQIRQQALDAPKGPEKQRLLTMVADLQYQLEQMEEPAATTKTLQALKDDKPAEKAPEAKELTKTTEEPKETATLKDDKPEDAPGAQPEVKTVTDNNPTVERPTEGLSEAIMSHVVAHVALSDVKGKKIGDLTPEQVKKVKEKWCDKYADVIANHADKTRLEEAKAFLATYRHYEAQGAYQK